MVVEGGREGGCGIGCSYVLFFFFLNVRSQYNNWTIIWHAVTGLLLLVTVAKRAARGLLEAPAAEERVLPSSPPGERLKNADIFTCFSGGRRDIYPDASSPFAGRSALNVVRAHISACAYEYGRNSAVRDTESIKHIFNGRRNTDSYISENSTKSQGDYQFSSIFAPIVGGGDSSMLQFRKAGRCSVLFNTRLFTSI